MQIYYIRHGQSANNRLYAESGTYTGRSEDPLLTELGYRQSRSLAEHIAMKGDQENHLEAEKGLHREYQLTHIYTSLMTRAIHTASFIARETGIPLVGLTDLHECGGIFLEDEVTGELHGKKGKSPAQLHQEFPELILPSDLPEDGWWNRPYEALHERIQRACRLIDWLVERHGGSDDQVAIISHLSFFNYFISALLGMTERSPVWFDLNNASITRIEYMERFRVIYMNRTHFLSADLIS